jgi:hypothetical protein
MTSPHLPGCYVIRLVEVDGCFAILVPIPNARVQNASPYFPLFNPTDSS